MVLLQLLLNDFCSVIAFASSAKKKNAIVLLILQIQLLFPYRSRRRAARSRRRAVRSLYFFFKLSISAESCAFSRSTASTIIFMSCNSASLLVLLLLVLLLPLDNDIATFPNASFSSVRTPLLHVFQSCVSSPQSRVWLPPGKARTASSHGFGRHERCSAPTIHRSKRC